MSGDWHWEVAVRPPKDKVVLGLDVTTGGMATVSWNGQRYVFAPGGATHTACVITHWRDLPSLPAWFLGSVQGRWQPGPGGPKAQEQAQEQAAAGTLERAVRFVVPMCPRCYANLLAPNGWNTVEWQAATCRNCGWAGQARHVEPQR